MSGSLVLDALRVGYGTREVIRGVSFTAQGGQLCALLGLNGSGKSTLLKAVCGLLKCQGGSIGYDGADLGGLNERARARLLSYIPQRATAASGLTVADVVLMGYNPWLGLLDRPSRQQRQRAAEMLERVGLGAGEDQLFDQLSEGQRQLAVFARALVQDAPVMLLDEPDSALDFLNRHRLLEKVADLVRREGKTGIITLHDPNFAMAYCDRLLLLRDGVLAGDVDMAGASEETLTAELGKLYGAVRLWETDGQWIMTQQRRRARHP